MRGELDLLGGEMELFEHLADVTMTEDRVGGEIVGGVHEVGVGSRGLAGSADSGLGVGDDAVIDVDYARPEERGEGEDHGGGVTAGISYEAGSADCVAVKLGGTVYGFRLELCGVGGVGVVELVDGSVGVVLEAPGTAQVDDLDVVGEGGGNPLAGLLVRGREEENLDAGVGGALPTEGQDLMDAAMACGG